VLISAIIVLAVLDAMLMPSIIVLVMDVKTSHLVHFILDHVPGRLFSLIHEPYFVFETTHDLLVDALLYLNFLTFEL
jgi:hypothetical protein